MTTLYTPLDVDCLYPGTVFTDSKGRSYTVIKDGLFSNSDCDRVYATYEVELPVTVTRVVALRMRIVKRGTWWVSLSPTGYWWDVFEDFETAVRATFKEIEEWD